MKKIILSLIFSLCIGAAGAQGIEFFEGTLQEALVQAKKENKLVFLDCSAYYCGGCRNMEINVFPQKEVGDFFNSNFICLHKMMDDKAEGAEIGKKYNIAGYPTWLFLNDKGYVVHKSSGFMEPEKFIALAHAALAAEKIPVAERIDNGELDDELVKPYLEELRYFRQSDMMDYVLDKLYRVRGGAILEDSDYWRAFVAATYDTDARTSVYLGENWRDLAAIHGEEEVLQKIRNLYISWIAYMELCNDTGNRNVKLNESKKAAYLKKMADRRLPDYKMLQQEMNFLILLQNKQYDEAYTLAGSALKDADARTLRNWAILAERKFTSKDQRIKAAGWIDRALKLRNDADFVKECGAIRKDLMESENPSFGVQRPAMPNRGNLPAELR